MDDISLWFGSQPPARATISQTYPLFTRTTPKLHYCLQARSQMIRR